jgi:hypothetical protein
VKNVRIFLFSALLLITSCVIAGADTIYATVGPDGSPINGGPNAYLIGGPLGLQQGDFFVPSIPARVGSVRAPFGWISGLSSLQLQLLSDNAGTPGSILDTFFFASLPPYMGVGQTERPLQSANSLLRPQLTAGTKYWLLAIAPPASSLAWYMGASESSNGQHFIRETDRMPPVDGFESGFKAAFRLDTARVNDTPPVPEPATLSLLAIGAIVTHARRRARTFRFFQRIR